jgi:hypothetical protein
MLLVGTFFFFKQVLGSNFALKNFFFFFNTVLFGEHAKHEKLNRAI